MSPMGLLAEPVGFGANDKWAIHTRPCDTVVEVWRCDQTKWLEGRDICQSHRLVH